jgi:predicted acyl esterase
VDGKAFLAYTTPPLDRDRTINGPASITIYASTTEETLSDWAFFAKVGEVGAEGPALNPATQEPHLRPDWTDEWTPKEVNLWSYGNLKTKFRAVDKDKTTPGQPWHPFTNPELLKPNTIYEFQIELVPIFNTFKKGHRIWLQIACEDKDYNPWDAASSYVMGPPPISAAVSIYHDATHPSHLLLPLIPDVPETATVEAPLCEFIPGAPKFTSEE